MDTIRDGILRSYGVNMWKRIVNEVNLPSDTFDFYTRYDDHMLINICDCKFLVKIIFILFVCHRYGRDFK
jgi:hypothetical protein